MFFFPPPRRCLPIISSGGLTVSGGGSMTVRAAALHRTDRLQISLRIFGNAIGLIALIQPGDVSWNICGRPPVFKPRSPCLEDEVKYELPSGASRIRWSPAFYLVHRPTRCSSTSLCCGKTDNTYILQRNQCFLFPCRCFCALSVQPDKQAQESVTGCYIRCNAAEPHD